MERQQQQSIKMQTATYAQNKKIPKLLGTLMEELVVHKPDDPVTFMINYLKQADDRLAASKEENLRDLLAHVRSNKDPQRTLRVWLQEINRGDFAKRLFPFHSNQLLKEYLALSEASEDGEVNDKDFIERSLQILAAPAIENSYQ